MVKFVLSIVVLLFALLVLYAGVTTIWRESRSWIDDRRVAAIVGVVSVVMFLIVWGIIFGVGLLVLS